MTREGITIEKIIKHLEYLKIAAEIDAKPESINAEIIGAAIEVIKERLTYGTYEKLAKVCVDNALHNTTIKIAGEGEMPLMEFLDKVNSGDFYVIRKEDTQIKPIPYTGEETEDESSYN